MLKGCIFTLRNKQRNRTMKTRKEILQRVGSQLVKDLRENRDSYQQPLQGKEILVWALGEADRDVWELFMK